MKTREWIKVWEDRLKDNIYIRENKILESKYDEFILNDEEFCKENIKRLKKGG